LGGVGVFSRGKPGAAAGGASEVAAAHEFEVLTDLSNQYFISLQDEFCIAAECFLGSMHVEILFYSYLWCIDLTGPLNELEFYKRFIRDGFLTKLQM
jgi:hypothetical protein